MPNEALVRAGISPLRRRRRTKLKAGHRALAHAAVPPRSSDADALVVVRGGEKGVGGVKPGEKGPGAGGGKTGDAGAGGREDGGGDGGHGNVKKEENPKIASWTYESISYDDAAKAQVLADI